MTHAANRWPGVAVDESGIGVEDGRDGGAVAELMEGVRYAWETL
jgi:hypothetical protein